MTLPEHRLVLKLAQSAVDLRAAARLRYRVFVEELGANGDHNAQEERDRFDPFCQHLILVDEAREPPDHVVAVYRLMDRAGADAAGGFYCETEYDLTALKTRPVLELGRSCIAPEYRRGSALLHLWRGIADYGLAQGAEVLFGVASFHGTDPAVHGQALSWLHKHHLAPPELQATPSPRQRMDLVPEPERRAAMVQMPPLIKSYLRMGGVVADGAFVDHDFNTTDVLMILEVAQVPPGAFERFTR